MIRSPKEFALLIAALALSACASQPNMEQCALDKARTASQSITSDWIASHRASIYEMCLYEGVEALLAYIDLDVSLGAGTFTSYIIGHDMDITDFEAARETGRLLASICEMDIAWLDGKAQVRLAIVQGIKDAIKAGYPHRY